MKTETWNNNQIRFVEKDGAQVAYCCDLEKIVERLSDGKYLSVHDTKAEPFPLMPGLFEAEDGRVLIKTMWTEQVDAPFPVFADIQKAYGMHSEQDIFNVLRPRSEIGSRKPTPPQGVYVVEAYGLGLYKIGASTNLPQRFCSIKTSCPVKIKILGWILADKPFALEAKLHDEFADKREQGEWFRLSDSDLTAIRDKYGLEISISEQIYRRSDSPSIT